MAKRYDRGTTIIYDRVPDDIMIFVLEQQLQMKLKSGRRKFSLGQVLTNLLRPLSKNKPEHESTNKN